MKTKVTIVLLNIILISCSATVLKTPGKAVVILLDLSESTNQPHIRTKYEQSLLAVLAKVDRGDALAVALITDRSVQELEIPIREEFPTFKSPYAGLTKKADEDEAAGQLQAIKETIRKRVEAILLDKKRKIMKTDILSSLQVAENAFSTFKQPRKMLVIMSDMLEDSVDYNFEMEPLTQKRIEAIIAQEKDRHRLPDLNGVQIYVVGAAAPTLDQYYSVQAFWFRYFKETGAILLKRNYGSALLAVDD